MRKLSIICCFYYVVVLSACTQKATIDSLDKLHVHALSDWNQKLTQVIVSDIFSPPVCSRIYAYANIAAYEALIPGFKNASSYAGKLNGLNVLPLPKSGKEYYYPVASIIAFSTVAEALVFDKKAVKELQQNYLNQLKKFNMDEVLMDSSVAYGNAVARHIIDWAAKDGYLERNALPAYIVTKEPGRWQPTPPNYIDAMETNWKIVRTLVMDSCAQFRPKLPTKYDTLKASLFYKEALQVYNEIKQPAVTDSAIAWYWDDNPNTSVTDGHITYFQQKNSPGGHWIYIACSVAKTENYDAIKTASLVSKTAIALFDGFISCWDAKYTYNYIRPETFINKYIDKDWEPLIQTPPFPEYPSGHSVASSSAATVLTQMVGDKYMFTDSAEVPFGRPTRSFNSFYEAADQASISRLYGGIHFLTAITNGKAEGRKVGSFVMQKLK